MIQFHYFKRQGSQPPEEITVQEFYSAAENSGLRISRPVNFTIADVAYSFTVEKTMPTPEEIEEAKRNWQQAMMQPHRVKLLLDYDEPVPEGYTGEWERRDYRAAGPQPNMNYYAAANWMEYPDGIEIQDARLHVEKRELKLPMSVQLLKDSQFDINGFFRKPTLTRKLRRTVRQYRYRLGHWLFKLLVGQSAYDFYEDEDDYED